jgi:hypothetical protein
MALPKTVLMIAIEGSFNRCPTDLMSDEYKNALLAIDE